MMNKKILAIFGNVAFYGQERANLQVFDLLNNSGYELLLLVNKAGFHWHLKPEVEARNLVYKKIDFSWNLRKTVSFNLIKFYVVNITKSNYQLYKAIKAYKPDYIHVCNDTHVMTLLPVLLSNKTRFIYRLGDKPSSHLSKIHAFLWKRLIIPRVDKFVCISKFVAHELTNLGCPEDKISIIYNFPPKRIAENIDEVFPLKDPTLITFTFIGQLSRDKGVDLLVNAFINHVERYPNCRLLIAGSLKLNPDFAKHLIELTNKADLESKILFLDQVKQIDKLFKITDVNIIPSVYEEPLSNVIVEAKANSKTSIVFASGGLPELVSHKTNGYIISKKTVESLVESMAYYCDNENLINEHGQSAFESIEKLGISYSNFEQKWMSVYE